MALLEKIDLLNMVEKKKPEGILSIYLDTDRSKQEQQHSQWKVRLKNGLKKLEQYLEAQQAMEEKNHFKRLVKKVEKEIQLSQRKHQKGLILFASSDLSIWELQFLQVEVNNEFYWDTRPALEQLYRISETYPPAGLIVAQQNKIRLLDACLGQIKADIHYLWDNKQEKWVRNPGELDNAPVLLHPRQLKKLIPHLQIEASLRGWQAVYLIGEPSLIDLLKQALAHIGSIHVIQKNLSAKSAHELLAQVM